MAGRLALWGSIGLALLALLGGIYSTGATLSGIDEQLDRNCRVLVTIQANTRFLILASENSSTRREFRHIFENAGLELCG